MAVISKGIKLAYTENMEEVALTNLQEIPDLGGEVDSIEITTLEDSAHKYTDGLIDYGESVDFKFLYENAQFKKLNGLKGKEVEWKITLPDTTTCIFNGNCKVRLDGVGVNSPLTYTLSIRPTSEFEFGGVAA